MFELLPLIPAAPLLGFLVLALAGNRLTTTQTALIGSGSVGISAILAFYLGYLFIDALPMQSRYAQTLGTWISTGNFHTSFGLYLDALSLIMILVITFVGFLIHVYSTEYMKKDEGYAKFFAYMNLFMASMLILVLADNLLLLYLGWEGVGLCSYLLIGFWYTKKENAAAAIKAFIVTRIGDTALAIGLFFLFYHLGSLNIQTILAKAPQAWQMGTWPAVIAALLLLGGAIGKSAQLPLQTWLPDAMAGPTPVSALIHAATMVTAGVYLIARMHVIYTLAPSIQFLVGLVGLITLLVAGCSALVQTDLKRALAYSTISQIGYMFLALGVGAWSAAMFHLANHAFFKALLFLAAGAIINAVHHEQNMLKMGGLRHRIPFIFTVFLIGASALASLPFITDGFYSKDLILWYAWSAPRGNLLFWVGGIVGALITAIYSYRMVFLVFFGELKIDTNYKAGLAISIPLAILAILSIVSGFIQVPEILGKMQYFSRFVGSALPETKSLSSHFTEVVLIIVAAIITILGIWIAYKAYIKDPDFIASMLKSRRANTAYNLFYEGWGFDLAYKTFIVEPFVRLARAGKNDVVDNIFGILASITAKLHLLLSQMQTGQLRNYAAVIVAGAVLAFAVLVLS